MWSGESYNIAAGRAKDVYVIEIDKSFEMGRGGQEGSWGLDELEREGETLLPNQEEVGALSTQGR